MIDIAKWLNRYSHSRWAWTVAAIACVAALIAFRLKSDLALQVEGLRKEYQMDQDLSEHRDEFIQAYQNVIGTTKLPQESSITTNAWIQAVQSLVAEQKLSLEELKPAAQSKKKGVKRSSLFLVVEGKPVDLLNFMYRIAKSDDYVYLDELNVSRSSEGSESVRAQMILSQFGGR